MFASHRHSLVRTLAWGLFFAYTSQSIGWGLAQDPASQSASTKSLGDTDAIKKRFSVVVKKISVKPSGSGAEPFPLELPAALSWSNPERRTTAGGLYLFTKDARPMAAMCIYPSSDTELDLEFHSLSEQPLTAHHDGELIWSPVQPGISWTPISASMLPGKTSVQRQRQMRSLARQFKSQLVFDDKSPRKLRLLDTPVYRVDLSKVSKSASKTSAKSELDVLDLAVFVFVQGTDPETILLIETVQNGKRMEWRYALARMTMVSNEVLHRDKSIWETEWARYHMSKPYHLYRTR